MTAPPDSWTSALRDGAGVGPVEPRGLLRFSGRDAARFVHRMCTQDVARVPAGGTAYGAFLEVKGHLVADALIHVRDGDLLLLTAPEAGAALAAHLRRYVVMDKVTIEELTGAFRCLPVLGAAGVAAARAAAGADPCLDDPCRGVPAVDLLVPAAEAEDRRGALVAGGAAPLDAAALEALRIAAGVPRFGPDMDAARLLLETGLTSTAVSFEKGCYIGQEVVLRGTFRGQVQRGLALLELPAGVGPGAELGADGKLLGAVTSAADTPAGRFGLGYLRRAAWPAGTRLETGEGSGAAVVRRALVVEKD